MKYTLINKIENFENYSYTTFENEILKGYIVFANSTNELFIYCAKKIELIFSLKLDFTPNIIFKDGVFFIQNLNEISKINIELKCLENFYSVEKDSEWHIGLLSKKLVLKTKTTIENFEIIEQEQKIITINSNEELFSIKGRNQIMFKENDNLFLQSLNRSNIVKIDITKDIECYNLKLDNGSFNNRIVGNTKDKLYVHRAISKPDLFNILAIQKENGNIIWETTDTHYYYSFDEIKGKLYGINGNKFEIINTTTGEKELSTIIDENIYISSHLTYFNEGILYFSSHLNNKIPVIGGITVENGKLDFLQKIKISDKQSFRIGLEKPIISGKFLYVKDSLGQLNIFERK